MSFDISKEKDETVQKFKKRNIVEIITKYSLESKYETGHDTKSYLQTPHNAFYI